MQAETVDTAANNKKKAQEKAGIIFQNLQLGLNVRIMPFFSLTPWEESIMYEGKTC